MPGNDERRPPGEKSGAPSRQQATASDRAKDTRPWRLTRCPCGHGAPYECIVNEPLRLIRDDDGWRGVYFLGDDGKISMRLLRDDLAVAS